MRRRSSRLIPPKKLRDDSEVSRFSRLLTALYTKRLRLALSIGLYE
jgi:hypothetical protein